MARKRPYELAGWEEDAEPVECDRCGYDFQPLERRCARCGWAPGDPLDAPEEDAPPGPTVAELRAVRERAEAQLRRLLFAATIGVVVAAPLGFLIGQLAAGNGVTAAIFGALIGGNIAGLLAKPEPLLLGPAIGTTWAIVYFAGAIFAVMASVRRYGPMPSWETTLMIGLAGGTLACGALAWWLTWRGQAR